MDGEPVLPVPVGRAVHVPRKPRCAHGACIKAGSGSLLRQLFAAGFKKSNRFFGNILAVRIGY